MRTIGFADNRKGPWISVVDFHARPSPKSWCAVLFENGMVWVSSVGWRAGLVDPQTVQTLKGMLP